jgi:hypothetical protein
MYYSTTEFKATPEGSSSLKSKVTTNKKGKGKSFKKRLTSNKVISKVEEKKMNAPLYQYRFYID